MNTLLGIDRDLLLFFNGSHSLFLDNLVMVLTSGLTWIPLYLALFAVVIKNNETMKQVLLVIGCVVLCVALTDGVADLIAKPLVGRLRPSQEPAIKYIVDTVNGIRGTQYGFFSAHAANTFGVATFFSLLIRNTRFTVAIVLWSLVNCWTRMYMGLHYPGDILAGLLWGAASGSIVYFIYLKAYLKMLPRYNYISSQYSQTGYSLADLDGVLAILTLTVVYAIFRALLFIV